MRNRYVDIDASQYLGYAICGLKKSGKSVLLEVVGETIYEKSKGRALIFDSYSAGVGLENAFWLIKAKKQYDCIFVHPRYCKLTISERYRPHVKFMCDEEGIEKIMREALKDSPPRIIVFLNDLYETDHMLEVLSRFYNDIPETTYKLDVDMCVLIREASDLVASSMKVYENAIKTKRALTKLLRIGRHSRCHLVFDAQILTSLYGNIRLLCDRIFIKRSTLRMLPDDLRDAIYNILQGGVTPSMLYNDRFYCVFPDDRVALIQNRMPKFRHKREHDNFYKLTGLTVDKIKEEMPVKMGGRDRCKEKLRKALDFLFTEGYTNKVISEVIDEDEGNTSKFRRGLI